MRDFGLYPWWAFCLIMYINKTVVLFLLILLISGGIFFFPQTKHFLLNSTQKINKSIVSDTKKISVQKVTNLGYAFYLGEIESDNKTNITDDLKNQITKIVYTANFSKKILEDLPIIIVNNLALVENQYISLPKGNANVPELKADFLNEGGFYAVYNNGLKIIYINKATLSGNKLNEVLTHELGHAIGNTLTDEQWQEFYKLRGISTDTPRVTSNWYLSPEEDFAEVYKNIFTGIDIRTYYGTLTSYLGIELLGSCGDIYRSVFDSYLPKTSPEDWSQNFITNKQVNLDYGVVEAKANSDPQVQACRRDAMVNPSKYPSDWSFGIPYKSTINQATKDYIRGTL